MSLYNIKSSVDGFIITKFDDDLNVESSYEYHTMSNGPDVCHCPAGQRPTCRHRQMFPMLQLRVDSPWMLDFDTRQWVDPTREAASAASSAGLNDTDIIHVYDPIIPYVNPRDKVPQGSLGRTTRMEVDPKTIEDRNRLHIYEDSPTADLPLRQVQEESHTYEQVTKLPDSHPFRRRM